MTQKKHGVPHHSTVRRQAKCCGLWGDLVALRERYKLEGLTPRDAQSRAYLELGVAKAYEDWRLRRTQGELLGKGVTLTPAETREVVPGYKDPSIPEGAEVGEEVLSLPEQVRWVKRELARVRNGGEKPMRFPSADVLYWYQRGVRSPGDFDKLVTKIEAPEKEADDAWMRDGEYQFTQIEGQLKEALGEVKGQLREVESGELFEPVEGVV